jgi:hypothetical protein
MVQHSGLHDVPWYKIRSFACGLNKLSLIEYDFPQTQFLS